MKWAKILISTFVALIFLVVQVIAAGAAPAAGVAPGAGVAREPEAVELTVAPVAEAPRFRAKGAARPTA